MNESSAAYAGLLRSPRRGRLAIDLPGRGRGALVACPDQAGMSGFHEHGRARGSSVDVSRWDPRSRCPLSGREVLLVTESSAARRVQLDRLLAHVMAARAREAAFASSTSRVGLAEARADTLAALESYAAAIGELSWPVPPSLRNDIAMYRALCAPQRHGAGPRP